MLVTTRMLLLKTTEKEKRDKLQVVKYAAENGNRAAERKFEMREKLVRETGEKVTLTAMKKTKKANRLIAG